MARTLEQFMLELEELYGPDELIDILNISSADLLCRFDDKVSEYYKRSNENASDQEIKEAFYGLYDERN